MLGVWLVVCGFVDGGLVSGGFVCRCHRVVSNLAAILGGGGALLGGRLVGVGVRVEDNVTDRFHPARNLCDPAISEDQFAHLGFGALVLAIPIGGARGERDIGKRVEESVECGVAGNR